MEFETQQKRDQKCAEQKLIAHLLAGVADILKSPGAKDLVFSLSKKITEVICERRLLIEHSFTLLSLLEDLSAWSVGLKDIDMLKGELELKAVKMKVGIMPDFIDPYKVADEIMLLSKLKNQQSGLDPILPPSPPPDAPEKDDKLMSISVRRNLASTLPLTIVPSALTNNGSRSRNQSLSSSHDLLTPGSSSYGDDSSMEMKCKLTKDGDDDTVTQKGLEQYPLPAWLNIDTFREIFEELAQKEGCQLGFEKVTDGCANSQCLVIHSERGWNIRRCKEKLNKYMEKIKVSIAREEDIAAKHVDSAIRIEYDRNKLLLIRDLVKRDSSSYCPQNLSDRARCFGVYVENR